MHYLVIRNGAYRRSEIKGVNEHNERRKATYRNSDIVPSRKQLNYHYKAPESSYTNILDQKKEKGEVSLRGLKADAILFDEFLCDVNSSYFEINGGYDFAKKFFEVAYQFCCQEVGECNIISAVLHADERNKALSEELGHDVFHYHLHVVYLPTVQKEIRYTKRCKDPELVGTIKAVINQISHSKKWNSLPVIDEAGVSVRDKTGKVVLEPSYGDLQTRFANYMKSHGYTDVERGQAGKRIKHRNIIEYKLDQDIKRAKDAARKAENLEIISAQLSEKIIAQKEQLTNLEDIDAYNKEVETCKLSLENVFAAVYTFFARPGYLRDKKQEKELLQKLTSFFDIFFAKLRQLIGFEEVYNLRPESCKSQQIAEEGRKLALELQIRNSEQRAVEATIEELRKEERTR